MDIRKDIFVGTASAYGVNALFAKTSSYESTIIALSFVEHSKVLSKSIVAAIAEGYAVNVGSRHYSTEGYQYSACYKPVRQEYDRFTLTTVINKGVGTRFLLTNEQNKVRDFYNYLMLNYKLPLKIEWTDEIMKALNESYLVGHDSSYYTNHHFSGMELPGISIHGENVPVEDVICYDFENLNDAALADVVSELVQKKVIKVADVESEPLVFDSFDGYISKYGKSIVDNLERTLEPLAPLSGELEGFAAKTKRLYPQQAACVNGIIALKRSGSQYGLMVEGMGCGKTLQGAADVDAYFNQRWLENHKGKDLKDLYLSDDQPMYRNILMAPSHLVEKWKEEITSEIPGAEVHIIKDLDSLLLLKEGGKERKGREWYLISKDFAKLGSQISPIPTTVAKMRPKAKVCVDCLKETDKLEYKSPKSKSCKKCGGRHFKIIELKEYSPHYGMICPDCGSILTKPVENLLDKAGSDKEADVFLTPADFAKHTTVNDKCTVCGTHLWGVDSKPIGVSQEESLRKKRWYKVSHYKNYQKKNTETAFVLKGHESDYLFDKEDLEPKKSSIDFGPRRYAPSMFIKRYLKGYFDFCVLDEAHKYESGGSAQSIAAHAMMKVSDFTLCLTGTITNGRADSLFYLLYMLDPRRMNKRGFAYSDVMDFARQYGCVETAYEYNGGEEEFKSSSRGRQIHSPKIKPGISPLLFTDFLLDKAVFLDLADLSSYLPALKEKVVICETPDEVRKSQNSVMAYLKAAARDKGGRAVLSTMLQFGLSYPDKPYGYQPIMHPKYKETKICDVPSNEIYAQGVLLPKEEKLVEIVNNEISQDRNCFIYCAYTGNAETNITGRLQRIVEENCNLSGQVLVMNASNPKATERENYIHKKASEGIRVFICNMKLVETGLDFCFKYNDAYYNYPSIIFYQLTYELAVMWQASRRHYRLNQKEECHTYYLANEGTLQQAAVQIMAEKQVAASAIQGKFSVDGLASMAKGIDPRVKLAQMLASEDSGMDRDSLENMFDVMNQANNSSDDSRYGSYVPPKTFYELMGEEMANIKTTKVEVAPKTTVKKVVSVDTRKTVVTAVKTKVSQGQISLFDLGEVKTITIKSEGRINNDSVVTKKKVKKTKTGQLSLFDLVA